MKHSNEQANELIRMNLHYSTLLYTHTHTHTHRYIHKRNGKKKKKKKMVTTHLQRHQYKHMPNENIPHYNKISEEKEGEKNRGERKKEKCYKCERENV